MERGQEMARLAEKALNALLAQELDPMLPGWTLTTESTRILNDACKAPDVIVETEVAPISIETKYAPGDEVEADALRRIGATVASSGQAIESAIALLLPNRLSAISTTDISPALRSADDFEWCVWIEGPASVRFPSQGFIKGSLTDLATFIETVAVSEKRITTLADAFEAGVSQAATWLRNNLQRAFSQPTLDKIAKALHLRDMAVRMLCCITGALDKIAKALHLRDSEQTTAIAVAIVANALVFQEAVSGARS